HTAGDEESRVRTPVPAPRPHARGGGGRGTPVAHGGRGRRGMWRPIEGANMNDTAVGVSDLGRLAERGERVGTLLTELRSRNAQLEQERTQLQRRLEETQSKLQGQDPGSLLHELAALKREQREWQAERRDVASRIEAISAKLERLE